MENKVKHLSPRLLPCIKPWLGPRGTVSRQLCPSLTIKMIVAGLVLVSIASVLSQDTPPPFRRIGCPAANLLAGDNYCFSPATNCLPNAIDHPDIPKNNNMYKVREPALNDGSLLGYIFFGQIYFCEAQGKGRAKGRPRKVTQRSFIDCRWWMVDILSLMLYTKLGRNHIADCSTVLLNGAVLQWSSRLYAWSTAPPQVSLSPGLS